MGRAALSTGGGGGGGGARKHNYWREARPRPSSLFIIRQVKEGAERGGRGGGGSPLVPLTEKSV